MQQMTASHAKQNFGDLMAAVGQGPVSIERHKKVRAIVCSPEVFHQQRTPGPALDERRAARSAQQHVEKDRLIRHQRLAIDLLTMPRAQSAELVRLARAEVDRWRRDRLCSPDYADRWDALLAQPVAGLARGMCSDAEGWGTALRQNSPWPVVLPPVLPPDLPK